MPKKVKWGVLGAAGIALKKVIPAMQRGELYEVAAVASRRGVTVPGVPRSYRSYEEILTDAEIEAIYNPLPNHMHVFWSIRAAEAGKHVLCEKPIGLSVAEARELIAARDRTGVKIGEAFMVSTHPQWLRVRELVRSGRIGDLRSVLGFFSYNNPDPANIRNILEYGGGGLMDIGCYPIFTSRFVWGREPIRAAGLIERDPRMKTDRLTSAILEFPTGQAVFTCSTQLFPYQKMHFFGSAGRIEIEIPFNAPPDRACHIFVDTGSGVQTEEFPVCDQYTIQGDLFSKAIRENSDVAVPLEDSVRNMAVIEAIFRSAESSRWEPVE